MLQFCCLVLFRLPSPVSRLPPIPFSNFKVEFELGSAGVLKRAPEYPTFTMRLITFGIVKKPISPPIMSSSHQASPDLRAATGLNSDHLVVLSHGIMGTGQDLGFLANLLESQGCHVLRSVSSEGLSSLSGLRTCGEKLAAEISKCISDNSHLKRLSVVGNSLGGLYMRYALRILFCDSDYTIGGLRSHKFMSIATPHLGIRNWTFTDDYGFAAPDIIKLAVSKAMMTTGRDIFGFEEDSDSETLLFKMATDSAFLSPLRSFSDRRLYANLNRDLVVPLGTAAFVNDDDVNLFRKEYYGKSGIVSIIKTSVISADYNKSIGSSPVDEKNRTDAMRGCLDSLGWDKVIVNFPGYLPIAHNQICALNRQPKWLFNSILGCNAGEFLMQNACDWLLDSADSHL